MKNIAVVGCGHWGKNLVRNFSELGSLAAVCDPDEILSSNYANLYKVNNFSFEEILNNKDIQGVVIAAPVPFHSSLGIEAMNAGKHVYIEKPLAMNNLEAKNIQKRSRQNYEVEEILSDFGKEGYELVNVITEPILDEKYNNNGEFLRTFFLKKERI